MREEKLPVEKSFGDQVSQINNQQPTAIFAGQNNARLINCQVCARMISVEAGVCPQCGHPNQPAAAATQMKCYSCPGAATTKCQHCNRLSCAVHLNSIYVEHGKGGAYELRCADCYESANYWKLISWVIGALILIFFLVLASNIDKLK